MINYLSKPFKWFFKLEAASGLILLIAAVLALVISNSLAPVAYERDDWGSGWSDEDNDCINTRHEVLILESLETVTMFYQLVIEI